MAVLSYAAQVRNRKRIMCGKLPDFYSVGSNVPPDSTGADATYGAPELAILQTTCSFAQATAEALASFGIMDPSEVT